jgi:hypothetical protein
MVPAVTFYDVVLSVHVMAVVAAFGLWFAYPLLVPRGDAAAHRAHDLADGGARGDYATLAGQVRGVALIAAVLVVVAIFFMVANT